MGRAASEVLLLVWDPRIVRQPNIHFQEKESDMRSHIFMHDSKPADVIGLVNVNDPASPGVGGVPTRITKHLMRWEF